MSRARPPAGAPGSGDAARPLRTVRPAFEVGPDGTVQRANAAARRLGIVRGQTSSDAGVRLAQAVGTPEWQPLGPGRWGCRPRAPDTEPRARELQRQLREVSRRRRQLERQLLSATEVERRRISLELHDGLGQHLAGMAYTAASLAQHLGHEGHAQSTEAQWLARLLRDAVGRVRAMSRGLWPVSLERHSLSHALAALAGDIEQLYGVTVQVAAEGFEAESAHTAHHLFRIAQEAVHNALRHGKARNIEIRLEHVQPHAMLSIVSDGISLDPRAAASASGLGLLGMRLRAQELQGELSVEPLAGGGTEVCLVWDPARVARAADRIALGTS